MLVVRRVSIAPVKSSSWNPTMEVWKMSFLFWNYRFQVSFRGGLKVRMDRPSGHLLQDNGYIQWRYMMIHRCYIYIWDLYIIYTYIIISLYFVVWFYNYMNYIVHKYFTWNRTDPCFEWKRPWLRSSNIHKEDIWGPCSRYVEMELLCQKDTRFSSVGPPKFAWDGSLHWWILEPSILKHIHMRVEQKVHERGFLCVGLWVCNE